MTKPKKRGAKGKLEISGFSLKQNDTVIWLSVKRVTLVAVLTVGTQLINILDGSLWKSALLCAGAAGAFLLSAAFLCAVLYYRKKRLALGRGMNVFCSAYIVLLALSMLPFLLEDARTGSLTNAALFAGVLMYAPLFPAEKNWALCLCGAAYAPAAAALSGAAAEYILRAAGISAAGVLLSYSLHSGYLDIIQSLRLENDQDDLTKLYSKKAGLSRMGSLLALCKRINRMTAAYYIDVDFFKSYNDTYGHLAGDHALMDVAACIQRCFVRETDVLCRMGGEEFAVLVPVTKKSAAAFMAQRLIRMVSDLNIQAGVDAKYFMVTVSIGVALFDETSSLQTTVQMLIDEADRQLYIAKREGRNCIAMEDAVIFRNEGV